MLLRRTIIIFFAATAFTFLSGESLWNSKRNSGRSMFADRISTFVGDILLVQVDETQVVTRSSNKSISANTNLTHSLSDFLYPSSGLFTHNGEDPSLKLNPNESFSGEGSYSDTNTLEAKVAVLIVDVLPNGNLVVEGARKTEVQGEAQYVVMRGIVRKDDVNRNNTVDSYNVLNANVEILGEGDLANAQKKGWINRLLDAVNIL